MTPKPVVVPSFRFKGAKPTPDNIYANRTAGMIQAAISAYASADEIPPPLPPVSGPPKYWCHPTSNLPVGAMRMNGVIKYAGQLTAIEKETYGQSVMNFYLEHPKLPVPELEYVEYSPTDWRRLSFPEDGVYDPQEYEEYPIALVLQNHVNPETGGHVFYSTYPQRVLYYDTETQACYSLSIDEANVKFKLTPGLPTGPGADNPQGLSFDAFLSFVSAFRVDSSKRSAAGQILTGTGSAEQKAKAILAL